MAPFKVFVSNVDLFVAREVHCAPHRAPALVSHPQRGWACRLCVRLRAFSSGILFTKPELRILSACRGRSSV